MKPRLSYATLKTSEIWGLSLFVREWHSVDGSMAIRNGGPMLELFVFGVAMTTATLLFSIALLEFARSADRNVRRAVWREGLPFLLLAVTCAYLAPGVALFGGFGTGLLWAIALLGLLVASLRAIMACWAPAQYLVSG